MGGANALAGTCDHFLNEGLPLPSLGRAPRCTVHLIAPLSHIFALSLGFLWISLFVFVCIFDREGTLHCAFDCTSIYFLWMDFFVIFFVYFFSSLRRAWCTVHLIAPVPSLVDSTMWSSSFMIRARHANNFQTPNLFNAAGQLILIPIISKHWIYWILRVNWYQHFFQRSPL